MELAQRVQVEGPAGDDVLDRCLLRAAPPPNHCQGSLAIDGDLMAKLRSRRSYFAVVGEAPTGFHLWLSSRHSQINTQLGNPYLPLLTARYRVEELAQAEANHAYRDSASAARKSGVTLQWDEALPPVTLAQIRRGYQDYQQLLSAVLRLEPNPTIQTCLKREQEGIAARLGRR